MSRRALLAGACAGLVVAAGGLVGLAVVDAGPWRAGREPPPALVVREATADAILANRTDGITFFRLTGNPRILIVEFSDPARQARMFDRLAALVERAGLPRDRILTPDETARAVAADSAGPEGFYWGHDYAASSLARFMALAARDGVALTDEERLLRRLIEQEGWLPDAPEAGVISVARGGEARAGGGLTDAMRGAILAHELAHGMFFAHPGYAEHARRFWADSLTEAERASLTAWLGGMGYDTAQDDLLVNEAQAYLFFTPNPTLFEPGLAAMTPQRREALRAAFLSGRDHRCGSARSPGPRGRAAPVITAATASAMRMPSTPADRIPPA